MSVEQEQINKLTTILINAIKRYDCTITETANQGYLTVFQGKGETHQLLLSIAYIGLLKDSDKYISLDECIAAHQHLTTCNNDGYCVYCGHRTNLPKTAINIDKHNPQQ